MFQPVFGVICAECSGQAALNTASDISRHHRIQASPGFRQAAHYVRDKLDDWGLDADQVLQTVAMYWADGKRTLAQIVDCVELETGQRNAAMLAEFFQWMVKLGLVTITNT